jgi:ribosome maturation factor RimP
VKRDEEVIRPDQQILSRIREALIPTLNSFGVELVDLQYRRENRGWVLRLFIDKASGITLNDCQRVSEQVGDLLDVEDLLTHGYCLEVSSPGLDRPLVQEKDFQRFAGRRAKISTYDPIANQRNFQGRILGVEGHKVRIERDEGGVVEFPHEGIARARLVPEFPGKGRTKDSCGKK